jgi:hypothetical protein
MNQSILCISTKKTFAVCWLWNANFGSDAHLSQYAGHESGGKIYDFTFPATNPNPNKAKENVM